MLVRPGGVAAGSMYHAKNGIRSNKVPRKTGAQPLLGSRSSFLGSIDRIPPSTPGGAPPFSNFWLMSIPSSNSVVVPVGTVKGTQSSGLPPTPLLGGGRGGGGTASETNE